MPDDTQRLGESFTIIRKAYRLQGIQPCTLEKGKKMAKLTLAQQPRDLCGQLAAGAWDQFSCFPDLGVARILLQGKQILVFANGEVSIRAAENEEDIVRAADLLVSLLT
ncbi:MAG: hypothetical protein HY520_02325 [Candidatus Aenigmarchaeota archaeon]|nr:hypothetical protein [Candidatus Aenigmarchaeota archaeon]